MAGIKGNKAHANSTSYPNQKFNIKPPKTIIKAVLAMLDNAMDDKLEYVTLSQVLISIGWKRHSKLQYWCSRIPILNEIKEDIQKMLNDRVVNGALNNKYNSTAAIWQSKLLGNSETSNINHKNDGGKFENEPPMIIIKKQ